MSIISDWYLYTIISVLAQSFYPRWLQPHTEYFHSFSMTPVFSLFNNFNHINHAFDLECSLKDDAEIRPLVFLPSVRPSAPETVGAILSFEDRLFS